MELQQKAGLILLRAIIWGLAGGFFGVSYLGFVKHLQQSGEAAWHVVLSAAVAGAVVATFYSAKRVALVGTLAGALTSLLYLTIISKPTPAWHVAGLCAVAGLLVGLPVSQLYERRRGALAVSGVGLLAGSVAGLGGVGITRLAPGLADVAILVLFMAPVTGVVFYLIALHFGERARSVVPHWLSIGIVSGAIAAVVGISMWLLSVTVGREIDPQLQQAVKAMFDRIPHVIAAGTLGGAISGAVLEVLGVRWLLRL